jgi:VWFA-related protein
MTTTRIGRRRWLAAVAALAAASTPILAQSQAKRPAEPPQIRIKSGVELVTTPLTIRDRKGRFLPDVKPDEIEVFEDGVRQTMVTFSLSHGGRLFNVTPLPQASATEGIVLPNMHPARDTSGRVFVIFIDDLHFDASQTPRVRDLFGRVAKQLIHEGDLFAIVSTGTSSIQIDPTYDRRRLDNARDKILGSGSRVSDILDLSSRGNVPPEVRHRVHVAFSTAYDLLNQFAELPDRRKSFIYISNGYDLDPFPEERAKREKERTGDTDENPFSKQDTFSDADLVSQLSELTRAARRANVAIYTIDPRGLVGGPDISEPIDMAAYQRHVSKTQDTLRVIAEQTGGRAVINKNDFDAALQQIDAETSDYYVIGYYASNTDPSKRRRTIEIKVKRPDVVVTHRTEYTLKPRAR